MLLTDWFRVAFEDRDTMNIYLKHCEHLYITFDHPILNIMNIYLKLIIISVYEHLY